MPRTFSNSTGNPPKQGFSGIDAAIVSAAPPCWLADGEAASSGAAFRGALDSDR